MILKGFRFGLVLQMAIGPVALLVIDSGATYGFWPAETAVLGIALMDGLLIALSCAGLAAVIQREKVKKTVTLLGFLILLAFGVNMIARGLGHPLFPSIGPTAGSGASLFLQGVILTLNPLGILFWGGVMSAEVADNHLDRGQMVLFGAGCVLSTLVCMTALALVCSFIGAFMSGTVISVLNILVGVVLIGFAGKRLLGKP